MNICCHKWLRRGKKIGRSKNYMVRFNHRLYTRHYDNVVCLQFYKENKRRYGIFFARKRYKLTDIIMSFFFLFSATSYGLQLTNNKKTKKTEEKMK